jgi:chemotaxis protein methyltransferase CheR
MNTADFEFLAAILKQRSGLVLAPEKAYLLESRLMPVARKFGFAGLPDLVASVRKERPEELLRDITEAMTTNESLFFRDMKPFDQFRNLVIPKLVEARHSTRKIRIWSAAASSGQEPYSIAIILTEMQNMLSGWDLEIVATDISVEMLNRARSGLYTQFEVQRGLPISTLVKYFKQVGEKWRLDAGVRSMVKFKEFNLLDDPLSLGKFDVVYCRNVLIYFDQQTKSEVLARISKTMSKDGVLYLGGAETVLGITDKFVPITGHRGMYGVAGGEPALKIA